MKKLYQKTLLSCFFLFTIGAACAQTVKTSVANGDWFNPATWSPAGVPSAITPTDSLIINTQVTFSQALDARSVAFSAFVVKQGASLSGIGSSDTLLLGLTDYLFNYGTISSGTTIAIGDINIYTNNYGLISCSTLAESDNFNNYGQITASDKIAQSGNFNNEPGGYINAGILTTSDNFDNKAGSIIVLSDSLIVSATLINNGDISASHLFNALDISGVTGKFCIANCFINGGNITGTVDLCDATPNNMFCDINAGTIASSVTYCAAGACQTVSVEQIFIDDNFGVYPNPSSGKFFLNEKILNADVRIFSADGKIVKSENNVSELSVLDLSNLQKGIYFLKISDSGKTRTQKLLVQ